MSRLRRSALATGLAMPLVTLAQTAPNALEEVMVTATRQVEAVAVQDVAGALTAFSSKDLQESFSNSLGALTVRMPNVQLDGIGNTNSKIFGAYRPLVKGRVYGLEVNYCL